MLISANLKKGGYYTVIKLFSNISHAIKSWSHEINVFKPPLKSRIDFQQ